MAETDQFDAELAALEAQAFGDDFDAELTETEALLFGDAVPEPGWTEVIGSGLKNAGRAVLLSVAGLEQMAGEGLERARGFDYESEVKAIGARRAAGELTDAEYMAALQQLDQARPSVPMQALAKLWPGEGEGFRALATDGAGASREIAADMRDERPLVGDWSAKGLVHDALQGSGQIASALAIGAATRNQQAATISLLPQVAGSTYADERLQGTDIEAAQDKAATMAVAEGMLEQPLLKTALTAGKLGVRVLKGTAQEAGEEAAADAFEKAYDEVALGRDYSLAEYAEGAARSAATGALAGGPLVLSTEAMASTADRLKRRPDARGNIDVLKADATAATAAGTATVESPLTPEHGAQAVTEDAAPAGSAASVSVDDVLADAEAVLAEPAAPAALADDASANDDDDDADLIGDEFQRSLDELVFQNRDAAQALLDRYQAEDDFDLEAEISAALLGVSRERFTEPAAGITGALDTAAAGPARTAQPETGTDAVATPAAGSALAESGTELEQPASLQPAPADSVSALDVAAHEAATSPLNDRPEPTPAQKEAGNYAKGHVRLHGLDVAIENPAGSVRRGVDAKGNAWESTLQHHYGYIKRTEGADGDHVDVFMGPAADDPGARVFVVDQIRPDTGAFDEHKVLLGFASEAEAEAAYRANYADNWQGLGALTEMDVPGFKGWLKHGDTTQPMAYRPTPRRALRKTPAVEPKAAADAAPVAKPEPAAIATPALTTGSDDKASASRLKQAKAQDKALATAMKAYPHDSLSTQLGFARGWQDARDGRPPARSQQAEPGMKAKGRNPVDEYMAGYHAQRSGKVLDVRTLDHAAAPGSRTLFDLYAATDKKNPAGTSGAASATERALGDQPAAGSAASVKAATSADPASETAAPARKPEPARKHSIDEVIDAAEAEGDTKAFVDLAPVSAEQAQAIRQATGVDVTGFVHVVDAHAIRHIFKQHGKPEKEAKRGQVAITRADVAALPERFQELSLTGSEQSADGKTRLRYELRDEDGTTTVVETVLTGRKKLSLLTMWKRRSAALRATAEAGDAHTSGTDRAHGKQSIAPDSVAAPVAEVAPPRRSKPQLKSPPHPTGAKVIVRGGKRLFSAVARETLEAYFRIGSVVPSYSGQDRVLEFSWRDEGWQVRVVAVDASGDPLPNARPRWHNTTPDAMELRKVLGSPNLEVAPTQAPVADTHTVTAGESAASSEALPPDAPAPISEPGSVSLLDAFETTMDAVRDGAASVEQFRHAFAQLVDAPDAVLAELNKKTKDQLLKAGGPMFWHRYRNDKKDRIVAKLQADMLSDFALGRAYGPNTYWVSASGLKQHEADKLQALRELVANTTAADLQDFAAKVAAQRQEAKQAREERQQALDNPQTLEQFQALIQHYRNQDLTAHEAYLKLSADQRREFDRLDAERTRETREANKRARRTAISAASQTTAAGEIVQTRHTKHGHDLWVLQLQDRVSTEAFKELVASARRLGGDYSSYRGNGAVPGWQFRSREGAEAFAKLVAGDTASATAVLASARDAFEDDRSQSTVERLTEMAERLEQWADASDAQSRKVNTARRARFAAEAERHAAGQRAFAQTMRKLAAAIDAGQVSFLDQVRTKTQIALLNSFVKRAKDAELRQQYASYADLDKHRGEPVTMATADHAEWPMYTAYRSDLATLARQLLEVDGTKLLGQRLLKVADDVSDAYLAFAKDNLLAVSAFARGESWAEFPTRDAAERAIRRSNLIGRAIPLQIKRGQHRVILSPSEAIKRDVWQGDADKRITLSSEFGAELMAAAGRATRRKGVRLSMPSQFEYTFERRAMLARMGIETGPEFRSALREFIGLREEAKAPDTLRALERSLMAAGRQKDGLDFFPTPAAVADALISAADVQAGMRVLEPSAGMGHIADRLRDQGVEPDVVEFSPERRELLEAKGFNVVGRDFLELTEVQRGFTYGDLMRAPDGREGILRGLGGMGSDRVQLVAPADASRTLGYYNFADLVGVEQRSSGSGYDRIIMNPPFSDRRDAAHVQHAYSLLKPGGRLVAIMGEGVFFGRDKKAEAFRDWLEDVGGVEEKLPPGSFLDPSLPVTTGAAARMVVIDKPEGDSAPVPLPESTEGVLFSTQPNGPQGQRLSKEEVQGELERFLQAYPGAASVHFDVLRDSGDLPASWTTGNAHILGFTLGNDGRTGGNFNRSTVGIVAASHVHLDDARATLRHEVLAHVGLDTLYPPAAREQILAGVAASKQKQVSRLLPTALQLPLAKAWAHVEKNYATATLEVQANELLAYVAETTADHHLGAAAKDSWLALLDRLATWVIRQLKAVGFLAKGRIYTLFEAREMVRDMAKRWRSISPEQAAAMWLRNRDVNRATMKAQEASHAGQTGAEDPRSVAGGAGSDSGTRSDGRDGGPYGADGDDSPEYRTWASGQAGDLNSDPRLELGDDLVLTDADYPLPFAPVEQAGAEDMPARVEAAGIWKQFGTRSPFFLRWFGQSAVTDEAGRPLIVYHGTTQAAGFTAFAADRSIDGANFGPSGLGHWTTTDMGEAEAYAGGGSVLGGYLRIENPKRYTVDSWPDLDSYDDYRALQKRLQKQGHDGVALELGDTTHYVFFASEQFKSVENRGTFDAVPNVLFRKTDTDAERDALRVSLWRRALSKSSEWAQATVLSLIPINRLKDFARDLPAAEQFDRVRQQIDAFRQRESKAFAALADRWAKLLFTDRKQAEALADLMHEATVLALDPSQPYAPLITAEQHALDTAKVKARMKDAKAGTRADYAELETLDALLALEAKRSKATGDLQAKWQALAPSTQALFGDVRDAYAAQDRLYVDALLNHLQGTMDNLIAEHERTLNRKLAELEQFTGLSAEERAVDQQNLMAEFDRKVKGARMAVQRQMVALRQQFETQNRVSGPYFPLARFGQHWAYAKDQRGVLVEFTKFETEAEQQAWVQAAQREGLVTRAGKEADVAAEMQSIDPAFVADLDALLRDAGADEQIRDEMYQLYLSRLPQRSMRHRFQHRKKTEGYAGDAFRAFAQHTSRGMLQTARLQYGAQLQGALAAVQAQAQDAPRPSQAQGVANAYAHAYRWILNPKTGEFANRMTNLAFMWRLSASPAAALVNMSQLPLATFPDLAAQYGPAAAAKAIVKALADTRFGFRKDWPNLSERERQAMSAFETLGLIDRTQTHDMAGFAERGADYGLGSHYLRKGSELLGWMFHRAEVANREATALATYRLASARGMAHARAVDHAIERTWLTQYDYSNANRPRIMRNDWARVALIFRTYSINAAYRVMRDGWDAVRAADPQLRKEAAKRLGWTLGTFVAFAGVMGTPFVGTLLWAAGQFLDGEDDELSTKEAFSLGVKEALGDAWGEALLSGAAMSPLVPEAWRIDLQSRIGLPNVWFRDDDNARDKEGRGAFEQFVAEMSGAGVGVVADWWTGIGLLREGETARGLEVMAPKVIKDAMKANRFAREGAQSMSGDVIVDEFEAAEVVSTVLGFTPGRLAKQYDDNQLIRNIDARISTRRERLVAGFLRTEGDERFAVLRDVAAFNKEHPAYAITHKQLLNALKTRAKRKASDDGGVYLPAAKRLEVERQKERAP